VKAVQMNVLASKMIVLMYVPNDFSWIAPPSRLYIFLFAQILIRRRRNSKHRTRDFVRRGLFWCMGTTGTEHEVSCKGNLCLPARQSRPQTGILVDCTLTRHRAEMELQGWIGGLLGASVVAVTALTIFQQGVASQLPTTVIPMPRRNLGSFLRCKQFAIRSARYHDVQSRTSSYACGYKRLYGPLEYFVHPVKSQDPQCQWIVESAIPVVR
jgi:hypothetical protein